MMQSPSPLNSGRSAAIMELARNLRSTFGRRAESVVRRQLAAEGRDADGAASWRAILEALASV